MATKQNVEKSNLENCSDISCCDSSCKKTIGIIEDITLLSDDGKKEITLSAKIDTGATVSSIHTELVQELGLDHGLNVKKVKNANGTTIRPIIDIDVIIHGKCLKSKFTITDRSHMKYPVLIGLNILKEGFLIDPTLNTPNKENELKQKTTRLNNKAKIRK